MISRQTYFPLVTEKVQKYFSDYVNPSNKNNEVWLDFNDIPLKWLVATLRSKLKCTYCLTDFLFQRHYPVGVLYDLYANDIHSGSACLPWCVNVHFDVNILFSLTKILLLSSFLISFLD